MLQDIFDFNCPCRSFSSNIFITFILLDPHCNHSASQLSSLWSSRTHLVPLIVLIPPRSPFHLSLCSIFHSFLPYPLYFSLQHFSIRPLQTNFSPFILMILLYTLPYPINPPNPSIQPLLIAPTPFEIKYNLTYIIFLLKTFLCAFSI